MSPDESPGSANSSGTFAPPCESPPPIPFDGAHARLLLEHACDLVQSVDPEGRFLFVNRCWREKLGYGPAEIPKLKLWDILRPDHVSACREGLSRVMSGETLRSVPAVFLARDGREIPVEGNATRLPGSLAATIGIFRDMTPPDSLTNALRESEALKARIVESAQAAILILDADDRITLFNPCFEALTGWSAARAVGRRARELFPQFDQEGGPSTFRRVIAGETIHVPEFLLEVAPPGKAVWITGTLSPLRDARGRVTGSLAVLLDVTVRRRSEEALRNAEDRLRLFEESSRAGEGFATLIGESRAMQETYRLLRLAAQSDVTVLLTGESGTGKELAARAIHDLSDRRKGPFLAVNCSALPESLLEAELFGHVKGAFTGAVRDRAGIFQAADGGTLFLDEIGELSPAIQVKLLRALQEREVVRVGDTRRVRVDVRLLTATNRDLSERIAAGAMREDFYYRIRVFEIRMPALRERPGDVPLLANAFVAALPRAGSRRLRGIAPAAIRKLLAHAWPGNVRELRNAIERAAAAAESEWIQPGDLPDEIAREAPRGELTPEDATERARLMEALAACEGRKAEAAKKLGMSRVTLWKKLKRLGLEDANG